MLDFHEKRKLKNLVYSIPVIALILVATVALSFSVYERYLAEREAAAKRAEQAHELQEVEARAAALEAQVKHLQSDRGIEEEIRDRFEVAKEGEEVIVIVGEDAEPAPTTSDVQVREERSLFDILKFW